MSEEPTTTSVPSSPAPQGLDLNQAVWQLRVIACGLGAALFILSMAFNLFVWKQNRNITALFRGRSQQAALLETRVGQLKMVISDFGNYSEGKPELVAIFSRYGLELKPVAAAPKP
jgi:hypothetical protein